MQKRNAGEVIETAPEAPRILPGTTEHKGSGIVT
ncbi:MAG: hypothetical protein JWQ23_140, partial [Herminiimonas sp.]|nr:hypothetical protein [Herminiimonas sp.]